MANRDESAIVKDIKRMEAEIRELKELVVVFCAPHAVQHGHDMAWPSGHIHPTHYDILARVGARMTDFVRHEVGDL